MDIGAGKTDIPSVSSFRGDQTRGECVCGWVACDVCWREGEKGRRKVLPRSGNEYKFRFPLRIFILRVVSPIKAAIHQQSRRDQGLDVARRWKGKKSPLTISLGNIPVLVLYFLSALIDGSGMRVVRRPG